MQYECQHDLVRVEPSPMANPQLLVVQRGSWWQVYRPGSIWNYLGLMLKGRMPGKPGGNWRQLGGDILIDADGVVRLYYINADPHDRPPLKLLLSVVRAAA